MGYKRTSNRGWYGEESLQAAVHSIADGLSNRVVAKQTGIPRRTLQRHSKGQVRAPGEQHLGRFRPKSDGEITLVVDNDNANESIGELAVY